MMRNVRHFVVVACCVGVFCLLSIGCSGGVDRPLTAKVAGRVTLDGQPVAGAFVQFVPQGSGDAQTGGGRPATGHTDAAGNFVLSTFEDGDGAVIGTHRVLVTEEDPAQPVGGAVPENFTLEVTENEEANQFEIELIPKQAVKEGGN